MKTLMFLPPQFWTFEDSMKHQRTGVVPIVIVEKKEKYTEWIRV